MAARLRVQPGLQVEIDPAPARPAVLGRVQLGIFDPAPAPAVSPDGACRLVLHGDNQAPALGVVLTLELFARAFLDPQEQERLGLDALDQVQLRDAAGWLVCTENVAPAAVAVHETPVDTLIPGKASQGPE